MKKLLVVGVIVLFLSVSVIPSTGTTDVKQITMPTSNGNTLYVGGSGPGNYTSIQDAIDDASDGDTVFVYNDSSPYKESWLIIEKSINLIGEDRDTTVIDGDGDDVVYIYADGVNISGFTIKYSYWYGIFIESCSNNISGNIILDHIIGIYISDSSNNIIKNNKFSSNWYCIKLSKSSSNIIKNNKLFDNTHGIDLGDYCKNNTIMGNIISNISCCTCIGVRTSSNGNLILNNTITSTPHGDGIILIKSKCNTVIGNTISNCQYGNGIFLWSSSDSTISCNNIISSGCGIWSGTLPIKDYGINLRHSRCNNINGNNIPTNSYGKHQFDSCNDNTIHHNNLFNNTQNAYDECSNKWDNGYPSGGNYWDDYNGTDADGDGIGDTPYNISGGDNQDRYPLMEPWGNNLIPIAKFTWSPSLPDPVETILFNASESIDCDGYITLYEWDWDNDGEYDENHTNSTATHSWSSYGYYPVTLRVTDNDNLTNSKTKTVRVGNHPPYEPSDPLPPDGATNVSIEVNLNWTCGDPDPGDKVTYDFYFGNTTPPPKVASNVTEYDPGILDYLTTYYWQIVAWDNWGASTKGPIWSFTTIPAHLEVCIVRPIEKSFYLRNMRLFPLPRNTIIVGYIDISVNATSDAGIEKVEFYIDNKLKSVDNNSPYTYTWTRDRFRFIHLHVLKVIAYDYCGNMASDKIIVRRFL